MPCISPDGKPTSSGMILLKSLKNGAFTPNEVSSKTGQSLYKVRSGLRELKNAGFVKETNGSFSLTESGESLV
jgi:predicted transcriptional regulator